MGLLVAPVEWAGGKVVINQLSKVASTEAAKSGIKSLLKSAKIDRGTGCHKLHHRGGNRSA
jgi:hypothetical protein